jgi:hypothetical protein
VSRRHRDSFVRRQLRRELKSFLRDNVVPLCVVALLAISGVLPAVFLSGPFSQGFIAGMIVVAVPCVVFFGFLVHTGGLDQVVGALGEQLTRDELAKAARHGHVWGCVHNLELGAMDIDHLVVAPGVILAVETKWHIRRAPEHVLHCDVAQARQSAETAQSVLRSKGIDRPSTVKPVVVVWGRGRLDIADGGCVVDGVRVLRGEELASRLANLPLEGISQKQAEVLIARLEAFAMDHRHRPGKHDQKRSIAFHLMRPFRLGRRSASPAPSPVRI